MPQNAFVQLKSRVVPLRVEDFRIEQTTDLSRGYKMCCDREIHFSFIFLANFSFVKREKRWYLTPTGKGGRYGDAGRDRTRPAGIPGMNEIGHVPALFSESYKNGRKKWFEKKETQKRWEHCEL